MAYSGSGYIVKSEEAWFESIMEHFKLAFPGMSDRSSNMLVIFARIMARNENIRDYDRVEMYNQSALETSTGTYLDGVVSLMGISRRPGVKGIGSVKITKRLDSSNMIIPAFSYIKTGDVLFFTSNQYTIVSSSPFVDVDIESVAYSTDSNIQAGTTFTSLEILGGVDTIELINDITTATSVETDADLRYRYSEAIQDTVNSSLIGVMARVRDVPGVAEVSGNENTSDVTDPITGIPAHAFELTVDGGTDTDVANTIFNIKPAGILSYGDIVVDIDYSGATHSVGFSRFSEVDIFFDLGVVVDAAIVTPEIIDIIKEKIHLYISMVDTVRWYELSAYLSKEIDAVSGIPQLFMDTSPSPIINDEITKTFNERFKTTDIDIAVVVV